MALPVSGVFLNKLFADPQFADMTNNTFEAPANFNVNLDCSQGKAQKQKKTNKWQQGF